MSSKSNIIEDMRNVMRRRYYSIRTEGSCCGWVKRFFIHFNMKSRNYLIEGEKKIELLEVVLQAIQLPLFLS